MLGGAEHLRGRARLDQPAAAHHTDPIADLRGAAAAVRRFDPAALVVSLGFDAFERDPSALLAVSTEAFRACGRTVGALGLQTLLVQEGGYAVDALGTNLLAFLDGFRGARR